MKACSKSDAGALVAGTVTVVLGIFFWFPVGRTNVSLMPPVSLEGKAWVLRDPAPTRLEPSQQARVGSPQAAPDPGAPAPKAHGRRISTGRKVVAMHNRSDSVAAPKPASTEKPPAPPEAKEASSVAVNAVIPPGMLDPLQAYTMQDLIDSFEADPSRYPLDHAAKSEGVAFSLEGLQRREKLVVLKVAVTNGADGDFFIKDFTVRAGATVLGSRSLFRILVEPQRVREGYVVFERPQAGASVQIKLKEDGGKGRSIETGIPYRF